MIDGTTFQSRVNIYGVVLNIWNGGSDLDNGQSAGEQGSRVEDAVEWGGGAYILVNWDNDDGDGSINYATDGWESPPIPDIDEQNVENEDNLAKLIPRIVNPPPSGTVELVISGPDADCIRLWDSPNKGNEIEITDGKVQWYVYDEAFHALAESSIWIEGIKASSQQRGVELTLQYIEYDSTEVQCTDEVTATIVMLHLGNAVYCENDVGPVSERCHAGMVYSFDGPTTEESLQNPDHFGICQMPGMNPAAEKLSGITQRVGKDYWYCYTNTESIKDDSDGYTKRLKILGVAHWLMTNWEKNYCAFDQMDYNGSEWDGCLDSVAELRCDGVIELAYEWNDIYVWGKIDTTPALPHYSIKHPEFLAEHNVWVLGDDPEDGPDDFYVSCLPITQGGFADQYIAENFPGYVVPTYRGVFWQTKFNEQRLADPAVLSAEQHEH